MPTIRDGRGVLTVHDMGTPPPARPPGEIERRQGSPAPPDELAPFAGKTASQLAVSRQRGVDASASRARGAAAAGFVNGHTGPKGTPAPPRPNRSTLPIVLTRRQDEVLDALMSTGSRAAAAKHLGVVYQSVDVMLEAIAKKGLLPAGLPDLPRRLRAPATAAPGVASHSSASEPSIEPESVKPSAEQRAPLKHSAQVEPESSGPPPVAELDVVPLEAAAPAGTIVLPCGGCSHAVVCSIRPILERDFPTDIVGPHPAIHLEVRCDHFLAATS